jgi:uncharacterized protein YbaR (Trm112 family)
MKPRRECLILLALACVIFMATATDALACPMCKEALASHDRSQGDWVAGFFWSILFMLSMPFVLLGSFSAYMYVLVRRARREAAERPPAESPAHAFTTANAVAAGR